MTSYLEYRKGVFFFITSACALIQTVIPIAFNDSCEIPTLKLAVMSDKYSSTAKPNWTRDDLLQSALNRLKGESRLLKGTTFELHYISYNGNVSSIGQTLQTLCQDVIYSKGIHGFLSDLQGLEETRLFTRYAGILGLPVYSPLRDSSYLSKIGYNNYIYLLPSLQEQHKVLESILQVIGASNYKFICGKGGAHLCNLKSGFIRMNNHTALATTRKYFLHVLAEVKFSAARIVVLDCGAREVSQVLQIADELEMLGEQYMWLVTETVLDSLEGSMMKAPRFTLGIRLVVTVNQIVSAASRSFLRMMDIYATATCAEGSARASFSCSNFTGPIIPYKILEDAANASRYRGSHGNYSIVQRISSDTNTSSYAFHQIATWTNANRISRPDSERLLEMYRQFGRYGNSNVPRLKIVTIEHGQYTFQVRNAFPKCVSNTTTCSSRDKVCEIGVPCRRFSSNSSTDICISGLMIELLKLIQGEADFAYDIYLVKDKKYGGIDLATGQWNGMIGDILSGEADMALATLTITASRCRVVDFSAPYGEVGIGILARTDSATESIINMDFTAPLGLHLWAVIISTIVMVMVVMWILDRKSWQWYLKGRAHFIREYKKRVTFLESMSYAWSTFVQIQAGRGFPRSTSARLVAVPFALAMLIVSSSYTAELAAHKVKEQFTSPITGIYDEKMLNPPDGFRYATLKDSSTEAYFRFSEDPRLRRIYEHMKDNNVDQVEDGVSKLMSGEFKLYIDDQPYLEHLVSSSGNCALRIVGQTFGISGYGIALGKNSAWTRPISKAIIKLNDLSTLPDLWSKWLKRKCVKQEEFGKLASGMSIDNVNGLFVTVGAGVVCGFVFLCVEHFVYFVRRRRRGCREIGRQSTTKRDDTYDAMATIPQTKQDEGLVNDAFDDNNSETISNATKTSD